jgi:hypothetical protein
LNFGSQANKTHNFSELNSFRDSLALPARTIHIQHHPLPASAAAQSQSPQAVQKAFDGVVKLACLNESSRKGGVLNEDLSITTGGQ